MPDTPLGISDDDLEELEYPELDSEEEEEGEREEEEENGLQDEIEETSDEGENSESEVEDEEPVDDEDQQEDEPEEEAESTEDSQEEDDQKGDTQAASDSTDSDLDFAAEGKRIFQPFKANGKEIKVANADDAITLMQMGANYSLKMAALKPNLKMLKTLEKNGLLSEDKINYLIDLSNKRPEAIRKAVKDAEIDPFDLDADEDTEYTPNTYTVSDSEMALSEVLDDLETSASGREVLDIVGNKWDEKSMQSLTQEPAGIIKLRDQVEAGVFARVSKVIDQEKLMGRVQPGVSDFDLYKQVGDMMLKRGDFNDLADTPVPKKTPVRKKTNTARKKAAGTTKSIPNKATQSFDPLAVSDEEFEKLAGSQYN